MRSREFWKYLLKLGTMSRQDADNVEITGGSISGVTISDNFTSATDPALNAATTAAIVEAYNGTLITLTGAGNSQTLANPTTAAQIKKFTVANNDTSTHSIPVVANSVTYTIPVGKSKTFIWDGTAWYPITLGIEEIPVKVAQGGTGATTLTDHGILLGSGTSEVTPMSVLSTGEVVVGVTGADPKALAANTTTTKKFLAETGTGAAGQDPEWTDPRASSADVNTGTENDEFITPSALAGSHYADGLKIGVSYNKTTDTWTRRGKAIGQAVGAKLSSAYMPYLDRIRGCVLGTDLEVVYYLDDSNHHNRDGVSPSVTGTDDAGRESKLCDNGVFTGAESDYKGKYVHNTTDDTYAMITAKDAAAAQEETVTLTGTGGTATIDCGNVETKTATFNGTLAQTAADFVTANAAAYDADGITLTSDGAVLTFKAKVAGTPFTSPTIANATGDLDGTVAVVVLNVTANSQLSISKDIMDTGETFEICTAVLNGDDGNVMIEYPKFYYRFEFDSDGFTLDFSEYQLPGFSLSPAHARAGREIDKYYMGKYEGVLWDNDVSGYITGDGTAQDTPAVDKIGSVAGYKPVTSMTRSEFETMCENVASGFHSFDGAAYFMQLILFWVTYAGGNSQSLISAGNTNFSSWSYANCIDDNGKSNALGMTDGGQATAGGDKSDFCVMFGVENPWGNVWKWLSNLNIYNVEADSKSYAMMEPTNNPDNYVDDADCLDSYEEVAELPLTDNYIKMVGYFGLPIEVGGGAGSTSYFCDYFYTYYDNLSLGYGTDWRVALVGGHASYGVKAGVSYLHAHYGSSAADSSLGGRLCAAKYKG